VNRARVSRGLAALILAASLGGAPLASAQEKPAFRAAAEAYDAGVQAHRQRDYARAALLFAHADELAPDPAARLAALKSVLLADDPVLGMTLAERAARSGPVEGPLGEAVKATRDKFAARVGRVRVACSGCTATIDAAPVPVEQELFVLRAEHAIELTSEGRVERRSVRIDGADPVEISPTPAGTALSVAAPSSLEPAAHPSPEPPPTAKRPPDATVSGLSPAWFFVGMGVTAVAAGMTIASGIDVRNREHDFYRAPTAQKAADGQAAETRTYVLGAVTGAAGLATAAIAVLAVRWKTKRTATTFGSTRSGFVASVSAIF